MSKNIISKKCKICNNEFKPKKPSSEFCSIECYRKHQRSGNYKFPYRVKKIETECDNCGNKFLQDRGKFKINKNNFCCIDCYRNKHKALLYDVKCNGCGKDIKLDQQKSRQKDNGQKNFYCGSKCRQKQDTTSICIACGLQFCSLEYRKSNNKNGFTIIRKKVKTCSDKCLIKFYKTDQTRKEKISIAISGEKHPNYVNGCSKNERIRKTEFREIFSSRQKRELLEIFNNKCFNCGSDKMLTVDHHLPFSKGGRLTKSNSVILCRSCNSSKNAKHPALFYTKEQLKELEKMGIRHDNLFNFIF